MQGASKAACEASWREKGPLFPPNFPLSQPELIHSYLLCLLGSCIRLKNKLLQLTETLGWDASHFFTPSQGLMRYPLYARHCAKHQGHRGGEINQVAALMALESIEKRPTICEQRR